MTTVVVYDEFKAVRALISGGDRETVTTDVEAGATRKFELLPGQVLEISEAKDDKREDHTPGPTVQEYVAAGYDARKYPPQGYESRSTQEEIDAAITAQANNPPPVAGGPFSEPAPKTE